MSQLRGYDWDGVLVHARTGAPIKSWVDDFRTGVKLGHECVILTCNTDPEHVHMAARVILGKAPKVVRFKRSDAEGKARWLAENKGEREAILIDDQWRHIEPCAALGVSSYHVGGLDKQS